MRVIRGDTWQRAWVISDGAGAPVDLTGCAARLQVRDGTGALAAEATLVNGRLLLDALAGRVDLVMPAAVMADLLGRYRFDIELTYSTGVVTTYEVGTLIVAEDVSHD